MASAREPGSLTMSTPESASSFPNAMPAVFAHGLSSASIAGSERSMITSKSPSAIRSRSAACTSSRNRSRERYALPVLADATIAESDPSGS
jgi:hypothetical protein